MGCCIQAIVKYTRALARSVYAVVFSTAGLLMNFYSCLALDVVDVSVCVCVVRVVGSYQLFSVSNRL